MPSKDELYERAGELGIEGRSSMNKEELEAAITEAETERTPETEAAKEAEITPLPETPPEIPPLPYTPEKREV